VADYLAAQEALLPPNYYLISLPELVRCGPEQLTEG